MPNTPVRASGKLEKPTNDHTCKTNAGRFDSNATQPKQKSYRDMWHVGHGCRTSLVAGSRQGMERNFS